MGHGIEREPSRSADHVESTGFTASTRFRARNRRRARGEVYYYVTKTSLRIVMIGNTLFRAILAYPTVFDAQSEYLDIL